MDSTEGPTWSDIAKWYDELLEAGSGPHETALDCLVKLTPTLGGTSVLDLACGQGIATRRLASAGVAHVVGIDSSEAMVAIARRKPSPANTIDYVVDDAQHLGTQGDCAFDGVTCQLGLMDIPDLGATLNAVHRVLKPGGWFVFIIGHPCFLVPDATVATSGSGSPAVVVTGYFAERFWRSPNPRGVRRAGNYHRMLSTYLNALIAARFRLEMTAEPLPHELLITQQPLYQQVPIFFAARAIRDD